jgi:murein L,D-transpeptidase YcbB/YkuD
VVSFRGLLRVIPFFVCLAAGAIAAEPPAAPPEPYALAIESVLRSDSSIAPTSIEKLQAFYAARQDRPAWYDAHGLNGDGKLAVAAIASSGDDALDPAQYELAAISKPLPAADPQSVAYRDVLLTTQIMRYASDVRDGRDTLKRVDSDIDIPLSGFDAAKALGEALSERKLPDFLQTLAPQTSAYALLKAALARYRAIAGNGGWTDIPAAKPYDAKTATAEALLALQSRLAFEDADLVVSTPPDADAIDAAMRRFQVRNGLAGDGVVGPATLALLNVPASARVAQISVNMERLRWLPHMLEKSYVEVNVPDATLHVIDGGKEALTSRVIVGRPADRTPIFRAEITDVVANPPWNVPAKITRNEIMPKVRKNPGYLASHNMVVTNGQVQQLPGAKNSLGLIKLNVSDRFSVYLHDTPSRSLFARDQRFLSHGCIRVQQITPLASYAITGDVTGGVDRLLEAIATGETVHLPIPSPIPLYVDYFTAFPAADGTMQFRSDIYGRDARMIAAIGGATSAQVTGSIGNCSRAG